jgi:hypothetical protein
MKTITLGKTRYIVRDGRDDIMAAHAKCTGKHKVVKSKGAEKRIYPQHWAGDSTADYVRAYAALNAAKNLSAWGWQPLSTTVSVASGEDAAWEVDHADN